MFQSRTPAGPVLEATPEEMVGAASTDVCLATTPLEHDAEWCCYACSRATGHTGRHVAVADPGGDDAMGFTEPFVVAVWEDSDGSVYYPDLQAQFEGLFDRAASAYAQKNGIPLGLARILLDHALA